MTIDDLLLLLDGAGLIITDRAALDEELRALGLGLESVISFVQDENGF